jgi:predicted dehydrogenase
VTGGIATKKRLVVVGLEHYHITGWIETLEEFADQIEIVALYDPDPELGQRLAPLHHDPILADALPDRYRAVPFETDLEQLLAVHRPDLALITLPNRDIPAAVSLLATAGVDLLIDKPGARTAAEGAIGLAAIDATGVKAAVGFNRRYGRAWQDARRMVAEGRIGRLMTTETIFTTSSVLVRDPSNRQFDLELMGGGILHWLGIHDLDLLPWMTGDEIAEVHAFSGTLGEARVAVEDVVSMSVRYASGAIGTVHYAYALPRPGNDGYIALRGTEGSIRIQSTGVVTWIGPGTRENPLETQTTTYELAKTGGYGPLARACIADWLDAIAENRQPVASYADAIAALKIVDAAYESARNGQTISLNR